MKLIKIDKKVRIHFLSDVFRLLSLRNFIAMATWRIDVNNQQPTMFLCRRGDKRLYRSQAHLSWQCPYKVFPFSDTAF